MSVKLPRAGSIAVALLAACQTGMGVQQQASESPRAPATYARALQLIDVDSNGKVDPAELAAAQQSAAMILALDWAESDTDGDGSLSTIEFVQAATKTMQVLLADGPEAEEAPEQQAQEDLASAIPFSLILERVAKSPRYVDEVAALRKAIEDASDDEEVVAYLVGHPALYPRLMPLLRTWIHSYPVRPGLLRYLKPSAQPHTPPAARSSNPPPAAHRQSPQRVPPAANKPPGPRHTPSRR